MSQSKGRTIKKGITNIFGSFGYLFCFLQWLWAAVLYLSMIQTMTSFVSFTSNKQIEPAPSFTFALPSPLEVGILVVVVTVMIAITIYALISMPKGIVKTSNKIVHGTADAIAPLVIKARHKQDTKRLRITITSKLVFAIKVLLVVMSLLLIAASGLLEKQAIEYSIAMIVGCGLACFSVVFFATQYLLAKLLRVKMADLW